MAEKRRGFFYGWVVVIAALLTVTIPWGILYSYGVFFKPMSAEFGWTRATTSLAYSIAMIMQGVFSIIMGWLNDKRGPRLAIAIGGFLLGLGILLTSRLSSIWQLYLFFGFIAGMGMGAAFVPPIVTVTRWFVKKRGLALGIVAAGTGLGAIIFPPLSSYLISTYDWRTAYLALAIIAWVVLFLVAWLIRRDPKDIGSVPLGVVENTKPQMAAENSPQMKSSDFSLSEALRTQSFWMLVVVHALCAFCTQVPMAHLVPYITDAGIPSATAAIAVSIIGVSCITGKIVLGHAGDRVGTNRIIALCVGVEALTLLSLIWVKNIPALFAFAAIFGFSYGGWVPQFPSMIGRFFGTASMGTILGVIVMGAMIGAAAGPFLAGRVFDISGSYNWSLVAAAVAAITASVLALLIKQPKHRKEEMY